MQFSKGRNQWFHHSQKFICRDFPVICLEVLLQSLSIQIFHDDIGSLVFPEKVYYSYDFRHIAEFRDCFCLIDKLLPAFFKKYLGAFGIRPYGAVVCPAVSHRRSLRIIFLDRNFYFQIEIHSYICDSKSALANGIADQIFPGENRKWSHMMARQFKCPHVKSTEFTDSVRTSPLLHAVYAQFFYFHTLFPLIFSNSI